VLVVLAGGDPESAQPRNRKVPALNFLFPTVLAMSVLAACASPPAATTSSSSQTLVLEEFFAGRTIARGQFINSWTGSKRAFDVNIEGRWDGRTLTLVEDFTFSDGERDRKTWYLNREAPGLYVGTREDVVGTARVWTDGKVVRLEYTVKLGGLTVDFADVLMLEAPELVVNKANVSKWMIPIGRVELQMQRAGS
jgi:hypothetical protein